jgi:hypothetical protein
LTSKIQNGSNREERLIDGWKGKDGQHDDGSGADDSFEDKMRQRLAQIAGDQMKSFQPLARNYNSKKGRPDSLPKKMPDCSKGGNDQDEMGFSNATGNDAEHADGHMKCEDSSETNSIPEMEHFTATVQSKKRGRNSEEDDYQQIGPRKIPTRRPSVFIAPNAGWKF